MQTLYYGGSIITMESITDHPEAVLVEDGIIKKVGSFDALASGLPLDVIKVDLQGRCLMPSFIDGHGHLALNGLMSNFADLSGCTSHEEIVEVLKRFMVDEKISSRGIVMATGYDHNFLAEGEHPVAEVLDLVSETIPVVALHTSGHLACANSRALVLMKITDQTKDPDGGRFGRIAGTNTPNGYMEEAAMMKSLGKLALRMRVHPFKMMKKMQETYVEHGVTTVQDGATNKMFLMLLKMADKLHKLQVDVVAYLILDDKVKGVLEKNTKYKNKYHKHLKIGGYKLILDGSPQGRSAWMTKPYLQGDEDYCGYGIMKDEDVNRLTLQAVDEGQQVLTHCNGDAAGDQWIRAYQYALEHSTHAQKDELRPVMIHCQTARKDQLEQMAQLRMIASIFVGHVYYWGDIHMQNFGETRGQYISPVRDALDLGICVNFHQDTPVTKPNMMHTVWCAVNRMSRNGATIGKSQAVKVYEALQAITTAPAYQYREEDSKGSICVGKRADLVILDKNPLQVPVMEIKDIRVLETIKDGERIFSVDDVSE
ncbi:MAG: amidohydrolase [Eubacteriales bacterium]